MQEIMEKILVTGAFGQLVSELALVAKNYSQFEWLFADRTQVSLDDSSVLGNQLEVRQFAFIQYA